MTTVHHPGTHAGAHAFNDVASWWRNESGFRVGATWFIMDKTIAGSSGPAVVDDFGNLVRVSY